MEKEFHKFALKNVVGSPSHKVVPLMPRYITLDTCLPFPDSVWEIIHGPASMQKVYQGING